MPSSSKKQAKLMRAAAHNPKFAKKVGIKQKVAKEFNTADKATGRYAKGGKVGKLKKIWMHSSGEKDIDPELLHGDVYDQIHHDLKIPKKDADKIQFGKTEHVEDEDHAVQITGPSDLIDRISHRAENFPEDWDDGEDAVHYAKGGKVKGLTRSWKKAAEQLVDKHEAFEDIPQSTHDNEEIATNLKDSIFGESDEPDWESAHLHAAELDGGDEIQKKLKKYKKFLSNKNGFDEAANLQHIDDLHDTIDRVSGTKVPDPNDPNPGPVKKAFGGPMMGAPRAAMPQSPLEMAAPQWNGVQLPPRGPNAGLQASALPSGGVPNVLRGVDQALARAGNRLADRVRTYADGGRVQQAISAIQQLAKKFEQALHMGDEETVGRVGRQMEQLQPGSAKQLRDSLEGAQPSTTDKLATFAKGGKVGALKKTIRMEIASANRSSPTRAEIDDQLRDIGIDSGLIDENKTQIPFKLKKSKLIDADDGSGDYFHEVHLELHPNDADHLKEWGEGNNSD